MNIEPDLYRVEDALGILVGKWKPIILLHLLKNGTQRFSDLKLKYTWNYTKNADQSIT